MKLSVKIVTLLLGLIAIAGVVLAKQSDALSSLQDFGGSLRVIGWILPLLVLLAPSFYRLGCRLLFSARPKLNPLPPFRRIRYLGRPRRYTKPMSSAPSWQKV